VPAPTAAPGAGEPLPAPLIFSDDAGRLARLERDGTTVTLLATPADPVVGIQVAENGTIVYTTSSDVRAELVRRAPDGTATVLLEGALSEARLAPDGATIAVRLEAGALDGSSAPGVYLLGTDGSEPTLVASDDPTPDPNQPALLDDLAFRPLAWSPDGERLLLSTFIPEADYCGLASLDVAAGVIIALDPQAGLPGCSAGTWSADGSSILLTLQDAGATAALLPGLFQADPTSGAVTPLVPAQIDGQDALVFAPIALPNSEVRAFAALVEGYDPTVYPPPQFTFQMVRYPGTGGPLLDQLRDDQLAVFNALWAPDGSGAVVYVTTDQSAASKLVWLPADGGAALPLPAQNVGAAAWGDSR
jgi:hypothetical protein